MAEDSEDDAKLLLRALRLGGYEPHAERVETAEAMKEALDSGGWDVVIADFIMPHFSGPRALRILQESGQDIAFIMVSGKLGEETAVEVMRAGAGDYILKDNLSRLIPAVEREIREVRGRRERRQTEKALAEQQEEVRRQRELLANLVETIEDYAIFMLDPDGRVVSWNAGAQRIKGYTEDEILGKHLSVFYTADEIARNRPQADLLVAAREGRHEVEEQRVRADGSCFWADVITTALYDPDGGIRGYAKVVRDITERRQAEKDRELFLHMVSHDLRIPLTIINGHAALMQQARESPLKAKSMDFSIDAILRSVQRMNVMIQDLVDTARFEGGQLTLKRQPIELADFLPKLLERSSPALDVSRIRLEIPAGLPPVDADCTQLERILINLLSNALKYSDAGSPIRVCLQQREGEVLLSIGDHGRGIPRAAVPHIFERYYRVPGERKAEGIGLGLYITWMLVTAHGGKIWVESEEGKGSTFFFTLPATASASD